ncbi:penicillin-binding protein, transpeptidase [Alkaliphilus metalliredigens QYMF]|uniref:Penicillin-binding protein, transpeptidase n=2 Tax=Alkaliphilus TaxID=114627 RepID=A6TQI2_ALKMQ|nr:penicillin-binding protein, transpeptidase [Alkaliphilus metalliredigens QYMF]
MIFKKLQDRFNVMILIVATIFIAIAFQLASIMLVQGDHYREQAENRIVKSIPATAARGEIRDRYGRLLAGNRPSFTLQIMKNEVVDESINEVALKLIEILEEDDNRYNDDFPIVFTEEGDYAFTYDMEIESWKMRHSLEEVKSAVDAFEILRRRYDIQGDVTIEEIVEAEENRIALEIQQQFIEIPNLSVPISILTWKFIDEMRKDQWLQGYHITDFEVSAYDAFKMLREEIYKIPETYSDLEARKIMVVREHLRNQGYLQYQPVKLAQDISASAVAQIEENIYDLPGVNIAVEPIRYYPNDKLASHLLGSLGKISQQHEIDRFVRELNYLASDIIGKTGLEHSFEETLKGKDGSQRMIVDARGRLIDVVERKEPIPGDTLYLTIDANLQRVAEETLEEVLTTLQAGGIYESRWGNTNYLGTSGRMSNATSGSVVVTDVKTGELLALANYPSYDPNNFATGISMTDWQALMPENERDPLAPRPLQNIALSTAIQPGSTFKMAVGLAGIDQGLSPKYEILDRGFIQVGGHSFGNWLWNTRRGTMGRQNLAQAIAQSNNYYFYSLANGYDYGSSRPLPIRMNMDILVDYTKKLGLDERTGIEIQVPRERSGGVPSIENKLRTVKVMLRNHLNRQMSVEDLDETKVEVSRIVLDEIIEQIVDWADENPSRGVLYNRLLELGLREEKVSLYTDIVKYSYYNQARWSVADTMNFAIGQGEHTYTPIQMTNYMAILANGGYRYNVSTVRKTQSFDGSNTMLYPPELVEKIELNDYGNLDEVNYGMLMVTESSISNIGSARNYFNQFPIKVAAKTGTAQRSGKIPPIDEEVYLKQHMRSFQVSEEAVALKTDELMEANRDNARFQDRGYAMRQAIKALNPSIKDADLDRFKEDYDHYAWFTGFAPYDDPEIAITVLIFQGGSGGYGAPILREIVAEYMGLNALEHQEPFMIDNRLAR